MRTSVRGKGWMWQNDYTARGDEGEGEMSVIWQSFFFFRSHDPLAPEPKIKNEKLKTACRWLSRHRRFLPRLPLHPADPPLRIHLIELDGDALADALLLLISAIEQVGDFLLSLFFLYDSQLPVSQKFLSTIPYAPLSL